MLKRIALAAAAVALAVPALAQNPRGEAKATVSGKTVVIDYGRPSLKGRDMLAQAQVGQPWRLGADAATTLTTETDLSFGEAKVPSGEYILTATKVDTDTWHLNVLQKADRAKVADIPLTQTKADDATEMFTIDLEGEGSKGTLVMNWGKTRLTTAFSGK
jgi:Protein of unknown function (DUF2911)